MLMDVEIDKMIVLCKLIGARTAYELDNPPVNTELAVEDIHVRLTPTGGGKVDATYIIYVKPQ